MRRSGEKCSGYNVGSLRCGAVVVVDLTVDAAEARRARARVRVDVVLADGVVTTRHRLALVDVTLTPLAREARHAQARVVAQAVHARAAVLADVCTVRQTRRAHAFAKVVLTHK